MKCSGSACVSPSSVTRRSCIASSSAAWVLGGVRLISSASSSSWKIGPRVRVNWLVWKLNRLEPRISPGSRSGVNWMRPNSRPVAAAKHCARKVLAVPGGPSSSTWPRAISAISRCSTVSSCPTMALPISARMASASWRVRCNASVIDGASFRSISAPARRGGVRRAGGPAAGLRWPGRMRRGPARDVRARGRWRRRALRGHRVRAG